MKSDDDYGDGEDDDGDEKCNDGEMKVTHALLKQWFGHLPRSAPTKMTGA